MMDDNVIYSTLSLEELVDLSKRGDALAVGEIVSVMSSVVEIKAAGLASDRIEKPDLIQEGMIGLLKAISSYDRERGASFQTYAQACIVNAMISALRKAASKRRIPPSQLVSLEEVSLQAGDVDIEGDYIERERLNSFTDNARLKLSDFEYSVFRMYSFGIARRDIAERLGVSAKSVGNALSRIRCKVKNSLSDSN